MKVWLNGQIVDAEGPRVAVDDRGFLLGDGLFETISIRHGHPFFLTEHLCRMQVSANELDLPIDRGALRQALTDLIRAQDRGFSGSARISVARGSGPRGLAPIPREGQQPTSLITLAPPMLPGSAGPDRLTMAPFSRSASAPSVRMKTLSYLDNLVARATAARNNASDAVFTNDAGDVTSTTMANIFVQMEDHFLTPPLSSGLLPGITRAQLLRYAEAVGVTIRVGRFPASAMWERWVFRSNSLIGVRPGWVAYAVHARPPVHPPSEALAMVFEMAEREDMTG